MGEVHHDGEASLRFLVRVVVMAPALSVCRYCLARPLAFVLARSSFIPQPGGRYRESS